MFHKWKLSLFILNDLPVVLDVISLRDAGADDLLDIILIIQGYIEITQHVNYVQGRDPGSGSPRTECRFIRGKIDMMLGHLLQSILPCTGDGNDRDPV